MNLTVALLVAAGPWQAPPPDSSPIHDLELLTMPMSRVLTDVAVGTLCYRARMLALDPEQDPVDPDREEMVGKIVPSLRGLAVTEVMTKVTDGELGLPNLCEAFMSFDSGTLVRSDLMPGTPSPFVVISTWGALPDHFWWLIGRIPPTSDRPAPTSIELTEAECSLVRYPSIRGVHLEATFAASRGASSPRLLELNYIDVNGTARRSIRFEGEVPSARYDLVVHPRTVTKVDFDPNGNATSTVCYIRQPDLTFDGASGSVPAGNAVGCYLNGEFEFLISQRELPLESVEDWYWTARVDEAFETTDVDLRTSASIADAAPTAVEQPPNDPDGSPGGPNPRTSVLWLLGSTVALTGAVLRRKA